MKNESHVKLDFKSHQNIFNALKIGMVIADFNIDINKKLLDSIKKELYVHNVSFENIIVINVPGALEIPFALQKLCQTNNYDGLIAIGCVIRGETYHFEIVSNNSAQGIQTLSLKYNMPIINAILTVDTIEQAHDRLYKSAEFAEGLLRMILLNKDIK